VISAPKSPEGDYQHIIDSLSLLFRAFLLKAAAKDLPNY